MNFNKKESIAKTDCGNTLQDIYLSKFDKF